MANLSLPTKGEGRPENGNYWSIETPPRGGDPREMSWLIICKRQHILASPGKDKRKGYDYKRSKKPGKRGKGK